jgi:hypothetical protein
VITRIVGDRRSRAIQRRIDRPEAVLLAVAQAVVATAGWYVEPFWVAAAVAAQLALGGLGGVRLIGPARSRAGFARYAMPATAGVAATLFGRILPGGVALLLVPLVAVLLWAVIYLELRATHAQGGRTTLELLLTATLFAGAAGILAILGPDPWLPPLGLIAALALVLALRSAEARDAVGGQAVGQALLHGLAAAQVGAATLLLQLPGVIGPAIVALAFYAWGGAAEALRGDASGRSVAIEFGALAVLGLVVALAVPLLLGRP